MSKHRTDPNYDTLAEREMDLVPPECMAFDFSSEEDFWRSYRECLRVIRERMANGGPGWTPKPPRRALEGE